MHAVNDALTVHIGKRVAQAPEVTHGRQTSNTDQGQACLSRAKPGKSPRLARAIVFSALDFDPCVEIGHLGNNPNAQLDVIDANQLRCVLTLLKKHGCL